MENYTSLVSVAGIASDLADVAAVSGGQLLGVFGIWKYFWSLEQQKVTRRIEARGPFLMRQLELYSEATSLVAKIVQPFDDAEKTRSEARFHQLYWGELCIVEDKEVENAMVKFRTTLEQSPQNLIEQQLLALELADSCRRSLAKSWDEESWDSRKIENFDKNLTKYELAV